jgi:hypothetical protein
LKQGDYQRARSLFEEGIRGMKEANLVIGLVFAIEGLASLYVKEGINQRAVLLFAWAETTRGKMGDTRPPVEQTSVDRDLAVLRSQMDASSFETLWREARDLTQEGAIVLALSNTP